MAKLNIVIINRRAFYIFLAAIISIVLISVPALILLNNLPASIFSDPKSGIIVIDAGHGGVDGGTSKNDILEKEINLDISKKLKLHLEQKGYTVIMTRENDSSLDKLSRRGGSRHTRDLDARVNIINSSNAQLFLSIHVNSNVKNPKADGSIVFYSERYLQNKVLAYYIQRALNDILIKGEKRTVRDPQKGNYYVLRHSQVPGLIVETAFLSNPRERWLLTTNDFRDGLARAISAGVEKYLDASANVINELE